jgi:hypothetical protein
MNPKGPLNRAVKAFQLYAGSTAVPIATSQKLYRLAMKQADKISEITGVDKTSVVEQLSNEAIRRGRIVPVPGKDY